jgi:hypothetical protein
VNKNTFAAVGATLEVLYLGHNPLSAVPVDTFSTLPYLHELYLDGVTTLQQLDSTSFSVVQQRSLRVLSLRDTNLAAAVWPVTSSLTALSTLVLSRSGLTEVPDFAFRLNTAVSSRRSTSARTRSVP